MAINRIRHCLTRTSINSLFDNGVLQMRVICSLTNVVLETIYITNFFCKNIKKAKFATRVNFLYHLSQQWLQAWLGDIAAHTVLRKKGYYSRDDYHVKYCFPLAWKLNINWGPLTSHSNHVYTYDTIYMTHIVLNNSVFSFCV